MYTEIDPPVAALGGTLLVTLVVLVFSKWIPRIKRRTKGAMLAGILVGFAFVSDPVLENNLRVIREAEAEDEEREGSGAGPKYGDGLSELF